MKKRQLRGFDEGPDLKTYKTCRVWINNRDRLDKQNGAKPLSDDQLASWITKKFGLANPAVARGIVASCRVPAFRSMKKYLGALIRYGTVSQSTLKTASGRGLADALLAAKYAGSHAAFREMVIRHAAERA